MTTQLNPDWILQIVEDDRHRKELAQMILEIQQELVQPKKIISKKEFKH